MQVSILANDILESLFVFVGYVVREDSVLQCTVSSGFKWRLAQFLHESFHNVLSVDSILFQVLDNHLDCDLVVIWVPAIIILRV